MTPRGARVAMVGLALTTGGCGRSDSAPSPLPSQLPVPRRQEQAAAHTEPKRFAPATVPAPTWAGGKFVWKPALPLDHRGLVLSDSLPFATERALALVVVRAPAVVQTLGLRDGVDEFEYRRPLTRVPKLWQLHRVGDEALRVEDGWLTVTISKDYELESIDVAYYHRGTTMPKRPLIGLARAIAVIQRRNKEGRSLLPLNQPEQLVLAFYDGRVVYAFGPECQRGYIDAQSAVLTMAPDHCHVHAQ